MSRELKHYTPATELTVLEHTTIEMAKAIVVALGPHRSKVWSDVDVALMADKQAKAIIKVMQELAP